MSKEIKKYLKNSIDEKGNYCYSLPVETTKAVIKELDRLNNIINELEKWIEEHKQYQLISERYIVWEDKLVNKLKELKENNK